MIFRRRQDEMEGFRRMREALRQQADPQDHALLDDDQYGLYDDADDEAAPELVDETEEPVNESVAAGADVAPMTATDTVAALTDTSDVALPLPSAVPVFQARPDGKAVTMIGSDTSWSGTLRSESDVYLEGRVEGTLEVRDTVYIAEQAAVDARIKARSVVVSGKLTGRVECDGRLEVTPTGRVSGEIEVGSLVVHEGAVIDGTFKMKNAAASQVR